MYTNIMYDYDDDFDPMGLIIGGIILFSLIGGGVKIAQKIDDNKATTTDEVVQEEVVEKTCDLLYNKCKENCNSNSFYPEDCYEWCDDDKEYCEEKEKQQEE